MLPQASGKLHGSGHGQYPGHGPSPSRPLIRSEVLERYRSRGGSSLSLPRPDLSGKG